MDCVNIGPELLTKQEIFANLGKDEIDFITSNSGILNIPQKTPLFATGEKASRFFILIEGEIRVFQYNSEGNEEDMARFTAGDAIGDFDFARGAKYDAHAEAAVDSRLAVFPDKNLTMDLLSRKNPHIVCSILLNAIIMMTARIKSTNKLVLENLSWVQDLHRRAYEDAGTGLWKQTLIADEIIASLKDPAALIMLKPDRFKILVDSRGHATGDEAMIKIALILKNMTRSIGHGWPLRFKSNEVGLIFNNCGADQAKEIAIALSNEIKNMEPVPALDGHDRFDFSSTISWCNWPSDDNNWNSLFQGNYANLLDTWKACGNIIVHYSKPGYYHGK
ncbi:MAG: diguanylate cyclase [Treponema sp.]|nr:diguanylate cyclase [Treponema sp.]